MKNLKLAVTLTFAALLITFAVQNAGSVEYQFLNWTFETRRALVVLVCTALGIAIGWLARGSRH